MSVENALRDTFTLEVDGNQAVQPALEIIVFSSKPRSEVAAGFVALHQAFTKRYKPALNWYKTNVMKAFKKASPGADVVEQTLTDKKALKSGLLGVEQHAGPAASRYVLPTFEFFSEEDEADPADPIHHSFARICLPASEAEHPDEVHAFVLGALKDVDFDSGYAGYSYYWNTGESDVERELTKVNRGWLMRFPGLQYGEPLALFSFVDKGILGVSWLTLLGPRAVAELGGVDKVKRAVGGDIAVEPIAANRGVVIRAGDQPELGDRNRNDTLPHYRKVGHAVAKLRVPDEWIENMAMIGFTAEDVVAWYGRFFDRT